MKTNTLSLLAALAVSALLVPAGLVGCGGGGHGSPSSAASKSRVGRASFKVKWPVASTRLVPLNTASILVTLRGPNLGGTRTLVIPKGQTSVQFDDLPIGTGYTATAEAKPNADGTGTDLAVQTSGSFEIKPGETTPFSVVMESTLSRILVSQNGVDRLYQVNADNTVVQVTAPGYASDPLTVSTLENASFTLTTRNAANELVLVDRGFNAIIPSLANFTGIIGTGGDNPSVFNYNVKGKTEGTQGLSLRYHDGSVDRTFAIPVNVVAYVTTTLTAANGLIVKDVSQGAIIAGDQGQQTQTLASSTDTPTLGAAVANAHTTNTIRVGTRNGTLAVLDTVADNDVVYVGTATAFGTAYDITDMATVGADLYVVDNSHVHPLPAAGGSTQIAISPDAVAARDIAAEDLTVSGTTTRYFVLQEGNAITRYRVNNSSSATKVTTFGTSGTLTVPGAVDVALANGTLYVLDALGTIHTYNSSTGAAVTQPLPMGGANGRIAAWVSGTNLFVATTDGANVKIARRKTTP